MRTIWHRVMMAGLAATLLALPAAAQNTQAQSLADQARAATKNKPAPAPGAKVWTNDNIPTGGAGISTVGPAPSSQAAQATLAAGGEQAAAAAQRSPEETKKLEDEWRKKFKDQKDKIALLQRELTVLVRENQIRAATFYADAGNRLRNETQYAADDRKYQAETAAKQKELDDAKQKLEDMKEELRKAGLPSAWAE